MIGYVITRQLDGTLTRTEASEPSRMALRRALERAAPRGQEIQGIVLGPRQPSSRSSDRAMQEPSTPTWARLEADDR